MNLKKIIRFKVGDVPWEVPLGVLILMGIITLLLMGAGLYMGYSFGSR